MMAMVSKMLERQLDKPASAWTPTDLHRTYLKYGCAVVRSVIEEKHWRRTKEMVDLAYEAKGKVLHVDENEIMAAGNSSDASPYEFAKIPLLKDFLDLVYQGHVGYFPQGIVARRVHRAGLGIDGWQPPLELHLDAFFHHFDWTVNFWIPFDPCGEDSPCLQFVPVDRHRTREFSGFSEQPLFEAEYRMGHFPKGALAVDRITSEFGENCFYRPKLNPGDVIVSSNWVIHGTHKTPEMMSGRTSIEIRFMGSEREPAEAAPEPKRNRIKDVAMRLFRR